MQKILVIQSSPRGDASISGKISAEIVNKLKRKTPDSVVTIRNLAKEPAPYLLAPEQIAPFYTPAEIHTAEDKDMIHYSTDAIAELMSSDVIVIATGMYSFTVAAVLKTWIDQISRAKITFQYTVNGPEGLVKGKKVYLALASGGVYSEGPAKGLDFQKTYLTAALAFLGMSDVTTVRVEGVAAPGFSADLAVEKAFSSVSI